MPHELLSALEGKAKELEIICEKIALFENSYKFENIYVIIETLNVCDDLNPKDLRDNILAQAEKHSGTALNLRRELPPAEANDIHLMYVCTPSESNQEVLKGVCSEIERDDRVCRKLIWMNGVHGTPVEDFIDKTFLARPWENATPATSEALRALTEELDSRYAYLLKIILNDALDGDDFVNELMDAVGGRSE